MNVGEISDDELKILYETLPQIRRDKADGYLFEKDRRLSLGAGYLLALALKGYGKTEADVRYDPNGKPYIPDIFFNLSHSGEIACIATADGEVGVDVEKISEKRLNSPERIISESERAEYLTGEPDEKIKNMFMLWTVKEAFVKMNGSGLSTDLGDVEYGRTCGIKYMGRPQSGVYVEQYELPGYRISACSRDNVFAPRLEKVTCSAIDNL